MRSSLSEYISKAYNLYRRKQILNKITKVLLVFFIVGTAALINIVSLKGQADRNIQKSIAQHILRFHVLANSDSKEDQDLKLKVKNEVILLLQKKLEGAQTLAEVRRILNESQQDVVNCARIVIEQEGYQYPVRVELSGTYFPIKTYGDLTFPEGEYEAYRVLIGKAQGKNWWCVLFPSLCMVSESYSIASEEGKESLQEELTVEEYGVINQKASSANISLQEEVNVEEQEENVTYRFFIVDWIADIFS